MSASDDGLDILLAGNHVSPATRAALTARLTEVPSSPRFLTPAEFAMLTAVCARLVPPGGGGRRPIASLIDARLADGRGDGWRYADLPPDGEAFRAGLAMIAALGGGDFAALDGEQQDAVLHIAQQACGRFFEELLAEVVERFYADPVVQVAIGYVGFADRPAWTAIGLDERDAREP
jgi:hypothetical protein